MLTVFAGSTTEACVIWLFTVEDTCSMLCSFPLTLTLMPTLQVPLQACVTGFLYHLTLTFLENSNYQHESGHRQLFSLSSFIIQTAITTEACVYSHVSGFETRSIRGSNMLSLLHSPSPTLPSTFQSQSSLHVKKTWSMH